VHVVEGLGGRQDLTGVDAVGIPRALGEEADTGVVGEDLLPAGGEGDRDHPGQRDPGDPGPAQPTGLDEDGRADGEGDGGEQLVGDAEEREELVDSAERVGGAGVEEVAPGGDDQAAAQPDAGLPVDPAERLEDVAEHVLEHEAADAGAGVDRGQDEQRLEHDRDALQQLPARQREALVLRHWLGLKEGDIAAAMGISSGSVKTHTARGLAALTQVMEARR
jgi:hypothetical protein